VCRGFHSLGIFLTGNRPKDKREPSRKPSNTMRAVVLPSSSRSPSPLLVMLLAVAALVAVAAQSQTNVSCVLDDLQVVESCFNASDVDDPCASCSFRIAELQLSYSSYDRLFLQLPTSSSFGSCEPAAPWVCPPQDNGRCCVRKATLASSNSFRALCARQLTGTTNGLVNDRWSKATVQSAVAGARIPIDRELTAGSEFYIRGQWGQEEDCSVSFLTTSNESNQDAILVIDRASSLATSTSGGSMVSSSLVSLSDDEDFNITVQFQWRHWDVYVTEESWRE